MRKCKIQKASDKESALEIIELAASDFESLARAFNLIADVCVSQEDSGVDSLDSDLVFH